MLPAAAGSMASWIQGNMHLVLGEMPLQPTSSTGTSVVQPAGIPWLCLSLQVNEYLHFPTSWAVFTTFAHP